MIHLKIIKIIILIIKKLMGSMFHDYSGENKVKTNDQQEAYVKSKKRILIYEQTENEKNENNIKKLELKKSDEINNLIYKMKRYCMVQTGQNLSTIITDFEIKIMCKKNDIVIVENLIKNKISDFIGYINTKK
ncbi:hypothetical protein SCORR_v1c10270 (plasmid) [Spiroplasma corruscae]|uniref:Uncharacterized protein n=1 Tax=Spiroplasma corruscae TaxID=216934 RepID=A0A222EQI8_9MOLU|nr:hypothetical protein [Spiroplasma corruscae]ASP28799.1 hypothetical protein SCORR_v1c10270 [Spiroplasma corruscae]